MTSALPLRARSVSVAYVEAEDRLVMRLDDGEGRRVALLVTRRLTGRLATALARLLDTSSPAARAALPQLRDDVVLMEHEAALAASAPGQRRDGPAAEPKLLLPPVTLSAVDVQAGPAAVNMVFKDARQAVARCDATRSEAHRLLDLLLAMARRAEWNLGICLPWAGAARLPKTLN